MTNTEDYQPQGTGISVDHRYGFRHFGVLSTACFNRSPGHIYSALQPHIANIIRYPQSSDSKPYYSEGTFGCSNTLGSHERKFKERTGIVP